MVNNKIHLVTKVSPFIANYSRELRVGADIKCKKDNGFYKENEENSRQSWSDVKKSIRESEKASRQEKKRSRSMEEE